MPNSRSAHLNAEINVTPFLDVLLVLLIIFLASMSARRTMDAYLPVPCEGACQGSADAIVLEVLGHGRYMLNHEPLSTDHLQSRLELVYTGRPDKVIQIAGRRDARYQEVLSAMDVARSAGVRVISIPPSELGAGSRTSNDPKN